MNDFYCAAPWRGLHINTRGDVQTCCAGYTKTLGNLNNKNINDALNGTEIQQIRSSLQQGLAPAYCINCVNTERNGGQSERAWHNSINKDFDCRSAGTNYEFPALIDIRWSSTCNLTCNYCGPRNSSQWAALRKIPVLNNTKNYYQDVCTFLEQHQEHVQEVALVGGEPLLLPENERLLDVIPEHCVVTIITNLNIPLENNKIFKKLSQRSRVGWSISFDNILQRFEYVRHGADWNLQQHNLDLVQNLFERNGHWGGIHAIYNIYNATRLVEFKKFSAGRGLSIKWQTLTQPVELDPHRYGQEIAELAMNEIQQVFEACDVDDEERRLFGTTFQHYQTKTESDPMALIQLKNFIENMEINYHHNKQGQFRALWPEIGKLLWP